MEKKVLIQKKKHLYKKIRILYNYIIENSGKKSTYTKKYVYYIIILQKTIEKKVLI